MARMPGVLLLLAGLLSAALLLLTGLLARILVLLARVLVRVGHRVLPCSTFTGQTTGLGRIGCADGLVPLRSFRGSRLTGS